ncbi:ABC transporter ATP-binding protein [bacterium BMS3Abin03]|nr:ABC transporter ATP-binding protein [bacterium BMS3Abin03]MCG6958438.1 ABC transporter ATP-binding protein [bacterium BMS3Abin03]
MQTDEKIIEVKSLTKSYKNLLAVDSLELNVYKGDIFGFLGPNGAGKSTTIRMLLTLIRPEAGTINLFGKSLKNERKSILSNIGALVEKPDFYNYLSAYKNLEILSRLSGKDIKKKRILEILEIVGLKSRKDSKVKTYSHGMKQRLGIAQTLLHNPDLIILDEPTTGLDPQGMKEIRDLIIHLCKEENKTIFLSSHILSEVEQIANRMIIINKGKAIVEGSVQELLQSSELRVTVEVTEIDDAKKLINNSDWSGKLDFAENGKMYFKISSEEISELNKFLVNNDISVNAVIPTRSLEQFFLKITEEAA